MSLVLGIRLPLSDWTRATQRGQPAAAAGSQTVRGLSGEKLEWNQRSGPRADRDEVLPLAEWPPMGPGVPGFAWLTKHRRVIPRRLDRASALGAPPAASSSRRGPPSSSPRPTMALMHTVHAEKGDEPPRRDLGGRKIPFLEHMPASGPRTGRGPVKPRTVGVSARRGGRASR